MERIILAASSGGGLVLDPCCGSGTVPAVTARLRRRWLAIEVGHAAAELVRWRIGSVTPLLPNGGRQTC